MSTHLFALGAVFVVLGVPTLALAACVCGRSWCPVPALLIVGSGGTALMGYLSFWAWFVRPWLGVSWTIFAFGAAGYVAWRWRRELRAILAEVDGRRPLLIALVVGCGYLGMLRLFTTPLGIDQLAANRFESKLPYDNEIPRIFAERLRDGSSPRELVGDWLSSDRPPLQAGLILFAWPVLKIAGIDFLTAAHVVGMWFQLLWIPACWAFAVLAGARPPLATMIVALLAATSLCLIHSVYVWPKLGAAALTVGGFIFYADRAQRQPARLALAGVLSALGWLAHGATAFSLLALAGLALFWRPWPRPAALAAGLFGAALLIAPWFAYQMFYEPPGNRLLKWHLAGVIPPDARGTIETMGSSYQAAGWRTALDNRRANIHMLTWGRHARWLDFNPGTAVERRADQFFYFFHQLGFWNLALLAAPIACWRRRYRGWRTFGSALPFLATLWVVATLAAWVLLMFSPYTTFNHQGSLAVNLLTFILAFLIAAEVHPGFFLALTLLHLAGFAVTWLPASRATIGPTSGAAACTVAAAAAFLGIWLWHGFRDLFQSPIGQPAKVPAGS